MRIACQKSADQRLKIYLLSAGVITMFLFFLDEGHYSFQWMANPGNWILFVIYAFFALLAEIVISELLLYKQPGLWRIPVSVILGSGLGIWFVLSTLFGA